MSFLSRLFGSKGGKEPDTSDVTSMPGIEVMLRRHLTRLDAFAKGRPDGRGLEQLCQQLLRPARLAFTVAEIAKQIQPSQSKQLNSSTTGSDNEWFVAITVSPWLMPDDVRAHIPNGYLALLDQLVAPALSGPKRPHIAHWIYCTNGERAGVHLTLIPDADRVPAPTILAQDLLTPSERRQAGI